MKNIDWEDIIEFYNSIHGLHFKTLQAVIRNGHKRYKSYEELALKFGISYETLRKKMKGDKNVKGIHR